MLAASLVWRGDSRPSRTAPRSCQLSPSLAINVPIITSYTSQSSPLSPPSLLVAFLVPPLSFSAFAHLKEGLYTGFAVGRVNIYKSTGLNLSQGGLWEEEQEEQEEQEGRGRRKGGEGGGGGGRRSRRKATFAIKTARGRIKKERKEGT